MRMVLPLSWFMLIPIYSGIAVLPCYRVPESASGAVVVGRIVRLGITFAALRIAAFTIVFHLHAATLVHYLDYLLVALLVPELRILTPMPAFTLRSMQIVAALFVGSFVMSAICLLLLRRIRMFCSMMTVV